MERFGDISMTEYLQQANDALLTIVQIETQEALSNVNSRMSLNRSARLTVDIGRFYCESPWY